MAAVFHQHYDYLIVGSGLYGCTFAREMTDRGKKCLVIDKRPQLGGNVACEDVDGVTVHKYGPHIFHTDSEKVWQYVNRFARFRPYVHRVTAVNGEREYSMPFNMRTFRQLWGVQTPEEARAKIEAQRLKLDREPANLEEQALTLAGRDVYEALIKGYTEKQWGRACRSLPAGIIQRIPLRFTEDDRYFTDKYQGIPEGGCNGLIEKLLAGIPAVTGMSYKKLMNAFPDIADKTVYTGTIDGFFEYSLGHLDYRSLRFETETLDEADFQGRAVVNYTDADTPYTRIIEHKYFLDEKVSKTVITREYPQDWAPGREAYYPVNDERNQELYARYLEMAKERPEVIFGGRLGEYRYYDMDDAIAAALDRAAKEP